MEISNSINVKGRFKIELKDANGAVIKDYGWIDNLITSVGKAGMAGLIGNTGSIAAFTYLALGTSSTAPAISDTTLGSEISSNGLSRSAATISRVTTAYSNDTLQLAFTWSVTGSSTIQEIGIFNAASVGIMLSHALTGSIAVSSGNQLSIVYQVQMI